MPSSATTGQLENAQRIVIAKARYTMEHSAPCVNLVESMSLEQGAKTVTVPKNGQMEYADLIDGVDLTDDQEIGMTTTDLTTGEVGAKIILTDKLVRQENQSVFEMVGRQFGDAAARKQDRDVIALFPGLNGSTVLGADDKAFTMTNLGACIAYGKAHKFGPNLFIIHHPNAIYAAVTSAAITPSATYPIPHGFSEDLLKEFYKFSVNQTPVFETGNIDPIVGATNSGYGVLAGKEALVVLKSKGFSTERERDASLRATELVSTADYGCFELDDALGAGLRYRVNDVATNN